jgi:integral membrane protein (TIGR01906 family)
MSIARAILIGLAAILVPMALVGLGVRMLLTPQYLELEYRLPGFPIDEYGFSVGERTYWGTFGIKYLLNDAPPEYLGDLRFNDGAPVFTGREVEHMRDVKGVVKAVLRGWYGALLLLAALGLWAWRAGWSGAYRAGLRLGGELTLVMAGAGAVLGTLGALGSGELFWAFFSGFHGLFFSGDSWLFAYSDTLIRLYPLRFWQDSILYIGVLAALGALGFVLGLRRHRPGNPANSPSEQ